MARKSDKPTLLSGGNPQIPKGYGDEPVQALDRRRPGLEERCGPPPRRPDHPHRPGRVQGGQMELADVRHGEGHLVRQLPRLRPQSEAGGAELDPLPPEGSKQKHVRYLHIHEDGQLDEDQLADWIRQASKLPGEKM